MLRKGLFSLLLMIGIITIILLVTFGVPQPAPLQKGFFPLISEINQLSYNKKQAEKTVYYRDEAVVLLYHDVDQRECGTAISPQRFASHLQMLEESGFAIVSLADIMAFKNEGKSLPANAVAITLDDACISNYQLVFPALQSRGWPFAIFVTINEIGKTRPNGLDRLNWPALKTMSRSEVLIGSHTYDGHIMWKDKQGHKAYWLTDRLEMESSQQLQQRVLADLTNARYKLEQELGKSVEDFAPPFGAYNSTTVQLAQQAGYKYIWTTRPVPVRRSSSVTSLGRVSVGIKGITPTQLKQRILEVANSRAY